MHNRTAIYLGIISAILAAPAQAQQAQGGTLTLEEVIVTAEKRETLIQDTAIAMSAYAGDFLQDMQITDVQDMVLQDPSMSFSRAGGEGQVFIRGVGSNLLGIGQDSSVAIHQDGVYMGRPQLALNSFLDVERVEVLRGPQGTLYGRNATAGVVNLISRKPTEELEGYVNGYAGNFQRREVEAAVGGPLGDTVGFRLAGRWADDDGFTDDLDPRGGDTIDDRSFYSVRGIVDFRPSDTFSAEFIADYSESDSHNLSVARRDNLHTSQRLGALPNPAFDETRNDLDTFQDWNVTGLTLTLNWDLAENLSFVSISGYRDFEDDFSFNTDGTEVFVTNTQYQREADQFTQEFRLATSGGNRVDWLLGAFYMDENKSEALGLPSINFGGNFNIFAQNQAEAWAIFSEVYLQLNDQVQLTGGLRYNDESKDDFSTRGIRFFTPENNPQQGLIGLQDPNARIFNLPFGSRTTDDSWSDWTPKVGIDYRPDDDLLIYASVTKGFKSGGTNSLDTSPPFDQEELWSYETGVKSSWQNNRVQANGSLFFYDYSDLQVSTFANGTTRIENAASADILGVEFSVSALLSDSLLVNVAATWLDSEYKDFITTFGNLPGGAGPNVVNLEGNRLINAPELKLVANARYEWQLNANTAYVFGQLTSQSEVFHSQFNESVVGQESLTLLDFRAGYLFGADRNWEVAAIIKNATDEEYFQNSVRFTSLSDATTDPLRIGAALGYPAEGRTYGVQVKHNF